MYITDFYMSLIIGVIGTLLFVETFGITPGGIISFSFWFTNNDGIDIFSFVYNLWYSKLYTA